MTTTDDGILDRRPAAKPKAKSWRDVLPIHPAADLFPLMSPDELKTLGEDIKQNGMTSPITIWSPGRGGNGEFFLLDGRNRLDALETTGVDVQWRRDGAGLHLEPVYAPNGKSLIDVYECCELHQHCGSPWIDPWTYVLSANAHRRHLAPDQKRELIAKVLKATPEKSDRQIASIIKASPTTVGTVRAAMEGTGDVSKLDTRRDSKGRKQPARKTATTKPPPVSGEMLQQRAAAGERIRALMGGAAQAEPTPNQVDIEEVIAAIADQAPGCELPFLVRRNGKIIAAFARRDDADRWAREQSSNYGAHVVLRAAEAVAEKMEAAE